MAEFVKRLRDALPRNVLDVRLFGSAARGEATLDSDLDVLVVVQPDTERVTLEDRIIDIAFDVNLEFGLYIFPTVVRPGILNDPVWRETPFEERPARKHSVVTPSKSLAHHRMCRGNPRRNRIVDVMG